MDGNGQQISQFCEKGKDEYHGYCYFCDVDIRCDNAGKAQLLQHSVKKKQKEAKKYAQEKNPVSYLLQT